MKLSKGDKLELEIWAEDYYFRQHLDVETGEVYSFTVKSEPRWVNWFIPCTADGFWNPILSNSNKRVKNIPCFKLCGTIEKNEDHHFVIGSNLVNHLIPLSGQLYFFANDHYKEKYYKNNKKFIVLQIIRVV